MNGWESATLVFCAIYAAGMLHQIDKGIKESNRLLGLMHDQLFRQNNPERFSRDWE